MTGLPPYPESWLPRGIRSRFVEDVNGLRMHVLEAGFETPGRPCAPLLHGFRGAPKADVAALAQLISQISVLAAQHADRIAEIEVNPVLVHPEGQGVNIVDALVVPKG